MLGLDRPAAAEFSFFLAMPTMTAAFAHDLLEARHQLSPGRGLEIGFVTNTTSRSRRFLSERLRGMGITAPLGRISTALLAGAAHLEAEGLRRVAALVPEAAREDLAGFELVTERPEAVVVGDLDEGWTFDILNTAFRQLMDGAQLIALSADRYWRKPDGLVLDCGPFVKALEYASGKTAAVCGKPSRSSIARRLDR